MIFQDGKKTKFTEKQIAAFKKAFEGKDFAVVKYVGLEVVRKTEKGRPVPTRPPYVSIPAAVQVDIDGNLSEIRYSAENPKFNKDGQPVFSTKTLTIGHGDTLQFSNPNDKDKAMFLFFYSDRVVNGAQESPASADHNQNIFFFDEAVEANKEMKALELNARLLAVLVQKESPAFMKDEELMIVAKAIPSFAVSATAEQTRLNLYKLCLSNPKIAKEFWANYEEPTTGDLEAIGLTKELIEVGLIVVDAEQGVQYVGIDDAKVGLIPTIKAVTEENIGKISASLHSSKKKPVLNGLKESLAKLKAANA